MDAITQIHDALKYLTPEVPLLAPAALNWAWVMYRLFAALKELPRSHVQAMVRIFYSGTNHRLNYLKLKMALLNGIDTSRIWHSNGMRLM